MLITFTVIHLMNLKLNHCKSQTTKKIEKETDWLPKESEYAVTEAGKCEICRVAPQAGNPEKS